MIASSTCKFLNSIAVSLTLQIAAIKLKKETKIHNLDR